MTTDLLLRRQAIAQARAQPWEDAPSVDLRPVVRESWRRCAPGVDAERPVAPIDPAEDTLERWDESPIRRSVPGLVRHLEETARSGDVIAIVGDADGRVLWQWTPRWLRAKADGIGLVPGGVWHEGAMGTNGIGLALAADQPAAVFATEHWWGPASDWVCYGAPIHAADGTQVGVIDLSTSWNRANPLALSTVGAMARLIEHELRLVSPRVPDPKTPQLDLRVLGQPAATLDGRPLRLTLRQFEILTILTLLGSATLGELHARLYGDRPVSMTTLKAEISHLRRVLDGHLASRPYRLTVACRADAVQLLERLDAGDVERAARLYAGQLLPASEAPLVVEHRHHVDVALRTALLRGATPSGALRYNTVHPFDVEVLERAQVMAPPGDPLVPALTARLAVAYAD